MSCSFKQQMRLRDMIVLRNKAPKWNEQLHAYCLNFGGRVTEASVKNFQLVEDGNADRVVLQFGKVQYPILALTSCLQHVCHFISNVLDKRFKPLQKVETRCVLRFPYRLAKTLSQWITDTL